MTEDPLDTLPHAQRERLAFVELRLRFLGEVRRADILERFGVQTAAATRDLALYRELAPDNIAYDGSRKRYVPGPAFAPRLSLDPQRVLTWLTQDFGDGAPAPLRPCVAAEIPASLSYPDLDVLAAVTRAIHQGCALAVRYHSLSRGLSGREILPFALIDTGLRWHVRAFDRASGTFRDFVLTRILEPRLLPESPTAEGERREQDIQWSRIVELELIPHPDQPRPEITALDFGLKDGVLRRRVRAACAGYFLRKWSVDCSPDHRLHGPEYRLWLRDPLVLYGVENAVLAPGYRTERDPGAA